jgi:hypothetical protein
MIVAEGVNKRLSQNYNKTKEDNEGLRINNKALEETNQVLVKQMESHILNLSSLENAEVHPLIQGISNKTFAAVKLHLEQKKIIDIPKL